MKNIFSIIFAAFFLFSCSKKENIAVNSKEANIHAPYDTAAIDSFSNGAISVDIAQKIRMSSIAYQDSLKSVLKQQAEEKKIKEDLEKEKKKLNDEEKKKKDDKKVEEKPTSQKNDKATQ